MAKAKVLVEEIQLGMAGAVIRGSVVLELENESIKAIKKAVIAESKGLGRL